MWDDITEDEEFFKKRKIDRDKYKEIILDQNFLKAQASKIPRKKHKKEKIKSTEKPFIKTGIIIIIIAIIAIIFVQYLPWMYLKYDATTATVEHFIGRDFKMTDSDIEEMSPEIYDLFSTPRSIHGKYSGSYIGLTLSDFTNIPETTFNLFIMVIIVSIIFTIYLIINNFRAFNIDNVTMIYSGFAATCIIFGLIVLASGLKFIASYFVLYLNWPYINDLGINDIRLVYIVPIIIIIFSSMIIKLCITVMKLNFRDIDRRIETERSENRFLTFKLGVPGHD